MITRTIHSIINHTKFTQASQSLLYCSPINNTTSKYTFFNMNKKPTQQQKQAQQQVKGQGRRQLQSQLTPLQNIAFPFPYEWTLQSNNYKYYDPRFTEQPIKKNLQASQKQHILYVLQNLEGYLNSGTLAVPPNQSMKPFNKNFTNQAMKHYLHQSLSSKLQEFLESLKSSEISIKLHIQRESIVRTEGYMQIQAKSIDESSAINFLSPKFIHEYNFSKEKELLLIEQKKKKAKKSQQQLLKQDVKDMMDQKSSKKELRQFFDQVQKEKTSDSQRAANFLMSKIKNLTNKKPQKKRQQEKYATSQLIKGTVHFQVYYKNSLICDEETDLHTKWMYVVEKNEPESIRKSRKRILYDFQFWNRGSFFQAKDWVKDLVV